MTVWWPKLIWCVGNGLFNNILVQLSSTTHRKKVICCYIYLEYVGDDCKVMFILLLVELLKVGGVIAFTVRSHLVPHLSLLSCLRNKKTQFKNTHLRDTL